MIAMSRAHGFMRGRRSWPAATRFVMRLRVLSLPALETMFQLSAAIDHTGVPHPMLLGSVDGEISARSSRLCAVHPPPATPGTKALEAASRGAHAPAGHGENCINGICTLRTRSANAIFR